MRNSIYNFILCEDDNGRLRIAYNFEIFTNEITIAPHGNDEVLTLLKNGSKYIINKKLEKNGVPYCIVCGPIRKDRLIEKCEKILGVYDLPKPIACCTISNIASLLIYDIPTNYDDEGVLVGMNNEKPRRYKLYLDEKTYSYYFKYGKAKYYLDDFMRL